MPATVLLDLLDQAYDHPSWHGTNLKGAIRGLTPPLVRWRPGPGRHNIQELVVHCAYWKYAVWRRLTGAKRGSFPLEGSNWFDRRGRGRVADWRADVALLEATHQQLREAVADEHRRSVRARVAGSRFSRAELISGAAAHDLYHAGQIQLIKALRRRRR